MQGLLVYPVPDDLQVSVQTGVVQCRVCRVRSGLAKVHVVVFPLLGLQIRYALLEQAGVALAGQLKGNFFKTIRPFFCFDEYFSGQILTSCGDAPGLGTSNSLIFLLLPVSEFLVGLCDMAQKNDR
jgi:hypothetical protein